MKNPPPFPWQSKACIDRARRAYRDRLFQEAFTALSCAAIGALLVYIILFWLIP
jgi:hypothetical protein